MASYTILIYYKHIKNALISLTQIFKWNLQITFISFKYIYYDEIICYMYVNKLYFYL